MKGRHVLLLFVFFIFNKILNAQCAMCKAVVEANLESGGTTGAGLNEGILYLMAIPYIAVFIFGIFYYFQRRSSEKKSPQLN